MKKLLLSLTMMAALTQMSTAQITITNSNAPSIGYTTFRAQDEFPGIDTTYRASGENQTWDLSMLNAYIATFFSLEVKDPSAVADHGASFPNADFSVSTSDSTNLFMTSDANSMQAVGLGGPFDIQGFPLIVTLPFEDPQKLLEFPCTYATAFDDTLFFDLRQDSVVPGIVDSARVKRIQTISSEIDGWGVVTTPSMSAVACLREHRIEVSTDSLWAEAPGLGFSYDTLAFAQVVTEHVYNWYIQDNNLPVVEIRTEDDGTINSVHFLANQNNCCIDLSVSEHPAAKHFNIFPNPTSGFMKVYTTFTEETSIQLFDMTGKLLLNQGINKPQNQFDVSGLANGLYVYRILDNKGAVIKTDKIQVQNR